MRYLRWDKDIQFFAVSKRAHGEECHGDRVPPAPPRRPLETREGLPWRLTQTQIDDAGDFPALAEAAMREAVAHPAAVSGPQQVAVYPCGTTVSLKGTELHGIVTGICIRDGLVTYDVSWMFQGVRHQGWLYQSEFRADVRDLRPVGFIEPLQVLP